MPSNSDCISNSASSIVLLATRVPRPAPPFRSPFSAHCPSRTPSSMSPLQCIHCMLLHPATHRFPISDFRLPIAHCRLSTDLRRPTRRGTHRRATYYGGIGHPAAMAHDPSPCRRWPGHQLSASVSYQPVPAASHQYPHQHQHPCGGHAESRPPSSSHCMKHKAQSTAHNAGAHL